MTTLLMPRRPNRSMFKLLSNFNGSANKNLLKTFSIHSIKHYHRFTNASIHSSGSGKFISRSPLGTNPLFVRYNSSQPNNNTPKFDKNGDRVFSDEEAASLLKELKKIWSDSSLDEVQSREKLKNLLDEYQMGGLVSPSASKLINTILTDESSDVPGEKIKNMHTFHKTLMDYHLTKQMEFNSKLDNNDSNTSPLSLNQNQKDTKGENKTNESESSESTESKKNASPEQKPNKFDASAIGKDFILNIIAMTLVLGIASLFSSSDEREISFQEFQNNLLDKGFVEKLVVVNGSTVKVLLNDRGKSQPNQNPETSYYFTIGSTLNFEEKLKKAQEENNTAETIRVPVIYTQVTSWSKVIFNMLPTVLLLGFLLWSTKKALSGAGGMGGGLFGQNKKKFKKFNAETNVKVNFSDVAGCDEAKEEIMEFVKFLKNPQKYERLGAKIPRGAILSGPPGTGKTLLAKATAGEAGVPFYSVSGSEFVEMFVGVGASRVRELFKTARENAPAIVFVDEIDAIGKARGKNKAAGGNDERENTLNQLLVEMDGFESSDHVVVLAGTNRADVLDPALLRPGRFDRKVYIDNPELEGRKDIFAVHLRKIKLASNCDMDDLKGRLSALTPGFSGADIANVCNEAALIAARHNEESVKLHDFEQAIERVIAGLEKKNKLLSPEEKKVVAYHEAGHAICGWFLEFADPLLKVSIVPRGQGALGYAQYLPPDIYLYTTQKLLDRMTMTLGGRVSEEIHFSSVTSGASDDFEKVTNMAQRMVLECGMSPKVGTISYTIDRGQDYTKPYSDHTAVIIDEEIRRIVEECYTRCKNLLVEKSQEVELVAQELLTKEVITREDMIRILGKRPFPNRNDAFDKYLAGDSETGTSAE